MYNFNNNFEVSNTTMVQCNIEASINQDIDTEGNHLHFDLYTSL